MLSSKKKINLDNNSVSPIFGTLESDIILPRDKLMQDSVHPDVAYQIIKDELMHDGNARLNLATFVQTYMEPQATRIMAETMEKNAIDKSEYPATTELENRCVNILANLWNIKSTDSFLGTSTVGSSEACMLGGLARKFAWRQQAEALGVDIKAKKPNLIISSGYQVCWEKFCVYWDIELREVPMDEKHQSIDTTKVMDYVDEYTIGIVGILGITYNGMYDDIKKLDSLVEEYNAKNKHKVYIHVDAASGGFFAPFVEPKLEWDFRLKNVVSISTSGHKYGLVYPGIGWIIWRDKQYLPKELIFSVSYLGGELPTMAINFSRSGSQIVGQYYNFIRFGFDGYRKIQEKTREVGQYIAAEIKKIGLFDLINDGKQIAIVCWQLKGTSGKKWSLYDLSDRLLQRGWQVPSYPMPANLQHIIVQRVVCRADLSMDSAAKLIEDIKSCIHELDEAHYLIHGKDKKDKKVPHSFNHNK